MTVYPIPPLTVKIAFDPPSVDDASVTWVDVSAYVRGTTQVKATRGRSDERASLTDPGTLSLTLDNTDARFTPGLASSPYYPNVIPWRRIWVSLGTVDVFYGWIKSWTLTWDQVASPSVQVAALDSLALLARRQLRPGLVEEVVYDAPDVYYRLNEAEDATQALDTMGGPALSRRGGIAGTLTFGQATGPARDQSSAAQWDASASQAPRLSVSRAPAWVGAVEMWVSPSTLVGTPVLLQLLDGSGGGAALGVQLYLPDSDGKLRATAQLSSFGPPDVTLVSSASLADGHVHHIVMNLGSSVTELYVDGVLNDSTGTGTWMYLNQATLDVMVLGTGCAPMGASNIAIYGTGLSSTQVVSHYNGGANGWTGESTYERLIRWFKWIGAGIPGSPVTLGEDLAWIDTDGRTVLDCAADALTTDYGSRLEASRSDSVINFHPRDERENTTATISLDASLDEINDDLTVLIDDTYVAATVNVTTGLAVHSLTNADVLAIYGESSLDVSVFPQDEGFADSLAEWLSRQTSTATPRIPSVSTDLLIMALDTSKFDATAIPELGDIVTLTSLPATAPATSVPAYVEGVTETISASEWTRTVTLSAAAPWSTLWQVEDTILGKIDSVAVIAL